MWPKILESSQMVMKYKNATLEQQKPKMVKLSKFLSRKEKDKYVALMKKFIDLFAWNYEDMKEYDTYIIQHTIPIKPNDNNFKHKLRRINPTLMTLIEKEVKIPFGARIIVSLIFSKWVANLVPMRKKSGEI